MKRPILLLWFLFLWISLPHFSHGACIDDYGCGSCQTCVLGSCTFQTESEDIKDECAESDCGTGLCNGSGGCGVKAVRTVCTDDGYAYTDDVCDGAGSCVHPVYQWAFAFKGDGNDFARSVCPSSDGGFMVAGYTSSSGAGNNDVWLLKLNKDGSVAWQRTCGGSGAEYAYAVEQVEGGGYLAAGYIHTYSPVQNIDVLALQFDSDGDVLWQKSFGGNETDVVHAAALTNDGGCVLAGYTESFGAGGKDVLVMKLSGAGDVIWQKVYGTSQTDDEGWSVQQTTDGGFIVGGTFRDCNLGLRDMLLLKLNQQGDIVWQKIYGEDEYDYAASARQTADGGYVISGHASSFDTGDGNMLVIKTDSTGNMVWHTTLGGNRYDRAYSMDVTEDGGYVLAGATQSSGRGGDDMWVVKLNSSGAMQWQRTYGGGNDDIAYAVRQTPGEGLVVTGRSSSFSGGGSSVGTLVLAVDSNGSLSGCSSLLESDAVTIAAAVSSADASLRSAVSSLVSQGRDFMCGNGTAAPEEVCFFDPLDGDGDGIASVIDNCPGHDNPDQLDIYPPGGNSIGDACECEGDFNCDRDCDGSDASDFKADFGRSVFRIPCVNEDQCRGDFDCDRDCDGTDALRFKDDFGRNSFRNPCPSCTVGTWCVYP